MTSKKITDNDWLHTCNRCHKSWTSTNKSPGTCAKCRSPYWNKRRKYKLTKSA